MQHSSFENVVASTKPSSGFEIIAHRGASYLAPENTLASVMLALEKGSDGVEIDVRLTKDNRIVAIHDISTKRTSEKDVKVPTSAAARLRELDVGSFKGKEFSGEQIPFLEEILNTVPDNRRLFIEIKCGKKILPFLEEVVTNSGKRSQVVIVGFDLSTVTAAKRRMPDISVFWSRVTRKDKVTGRWLFHNPNLVRKTKSRSLDGLNVYREGVTERFVEAVKAAGLELYVWTVDEPQEALRLKKLGVNGIMTNRPSWLLDKL